jgi:hypothetical protein
MERLFMPLPGHAARRGAQPKLRLELEEKLDAEAVARAKGLVERSPPDALVILDFGAVRDFDPAALAGLFTALLRAGESRVELCGLCDQHTRLLRYLGVDVSCLERRREPAVAGPALP